MPVYKDKKTNKWYAKVNFVDDFGKYRSKYSKYFDTKREATEEEYRIKARLKEKQSSSSSVTFEQIYKEFLEWKKETVKTSTCITYPSMWTHLEPLHNVKIKSLTVPQYKAFKKTLDDKGLSIPRKNKVHKFARQLVNYAKSQYDVKCDVFDKVEGFKDPNKIRVKKVDFYTYDEFQKFICQVEDIRYHSLFMVLYYQGTRIGEANCLTWKDIDFKKHLMTINKTVNTKIKGVPYLITSTKKTASDRTLPIEKETEKVLLKLKEHWKQYTNFSEEWFIFGGVRPLGESWIFDVKNEAAKKANIKRIRVHDFRHSCASFLIEIGCQPMVVQKYLGHASLKITLDTYSHMYPNRLEEASMLINEFKNK